ncbi:hypothetical protein OPKNFCMD_2217 [Methylobacterium crusticola]|uniref:Uncharacterized protein n=1 Tax=Methylobacterium crusticola TaxID=1697972 RepID=A0ABQ4QVW1_9HYPH|nr:hypothetical protein [Methylobacterium crusticola]GJD49486.1 hypothetical protein OPKNFCMD_2217 [Methylobacterium crusticola]
MSDANAKSTPPQDGPGSRQDSPPPKDKDLKANEQDKLAERLDQGLEETFPSSDPVSVKITK